MSIIVNWPTNALSEIIYISRVQTPFGKAGITQLKQIVKCSQKSNATDGITGVLYFDGAYFIQVLEGGRDVVECRFAAICRDTRHHHVNVAERAELQSRHFSGCHMALVTEAEMMEVQGLYPDLPNAKQFDAPAFIRNMRDAVAVQAVSPPAT